MCGAEQRETWEIKRRNEVNLPGGNVRGNIRDFKPFQNSWSLAQRTRQIYSTIIPSIYASIYTAVLPGGGAEQVCR